MPYHIPHSSSSKFSIFWSPQRDCYTLTPSISLPGKSRTSDLSFLRLTFPPTSCLSVFLTSSPFSLLWNLLHQLYFTFYTFSSLLFWCLFFNHVSFPYIKDFFFNPANISRCHTPYFLIFAFSFPQRTLSLTSGNLDSPKLLLKLKATWVSQSIESFSLSWLVSLPFLKCMT